MYFIHFLIVVTSAFNHVSSEKDLFCCEASSPAERYEALRKFSDGGQKFYGIYKRDDTNSDEGSDASSNYFSIPDFVKPQDKKIQTESMKGEDDPKSSQAIKVFDTRDKSDSVSTSISTDEVDVHENEKEAKPKDISTRFARQSDFKALHDNDLKVVGILEHKISRIFSSLLKCISTDESTYFNDFERKILDYEVELMEINADLYKMTATENVFRGEISLWLDRTNNLFQLLRYRIALKLRYGTTTDDPLASRDLLDIGSICLGLVDFELLLFTFYSPKVNLVINAETAEARLASIRNKIKKLNSNDTQFSSYFESEVERLMGLVQVLKIGKEAIVFQIDGVTRNELSANQLSDEVIYSRSLQLEKSLQTLEGLMVQISENEDMDLRQYNSMKLSILEQIARLEAHTIPEEFRETLSKFSKMVMNKLYCMDEVIACARDKICTHANEYLQKCLNFSFQTFSERVRELDQRTENLLLEVRSRGEGSGVIDTEVLRAAMEDHKFYALAYRNTDTDAWSITHDVEEVRKLLTNIFENLRKAEKILEECEDSTGTDIGTGTEGLVSDHGYASTAKENSKMNKDDQELELQKQLRQIEVLLDKYLDPKLSDPHNLRELILSQKFIFVHLKKKGEEEGYITSESTKKLIEKMSNLFPLLEEIFERRHSKSERNM